MKKNILLYLCLFTFIMNLTASNVTLDDFGDLTSDQCKTAIKQAAEFNAKTTQELTNLQEKLEEVSSDKKDLEKLNASLEQNFDKLSAGHKAAEQQVKKLEAEIKDFHDGEKAPDAFKNTAEQIKELENYLNDTETEIQKHQTEASEYKSKTEKLTSALHETKQDLQLTQADLVDRKK